MRYPWNRIVGRVAAPAVAALLLASGAAFAQDEGSDPPRPLGPPPGLAPTEHDHQGELLELFATVERKLRM